MKRLNVLVFPCGSENASEIYQSLRYSLHVQLFGASSVEDHGRFRFDNYIEGIPNISSPEFDTRFSKVLSDHSIDIIFATHDTVAEYLAERAEQLRGVYLVNGDPRTATLLRSKRASYNFFSDQDWCPTVYATPEDVHSWPVIAKPDRGQGGQGVELVRDASQATRLLASDPDILLVEYLPGEELTVDCFTDRLRRLVWVGPRTRGRVRGGISMRSSGVNTDDRLTAIARTINSRLKLRGPWFFQVKRDHQGEWKLLEAACRVAGTMVYQRAHGINLPLMAIHDYLGRELIPLPNPYITLIERNIATRAELEISYDQVYVDLDDTLILRGQVVPKILAFLYQCASEGKTLHLLTRHSADPYETLRKAKISIDLFESIILVQKGEKKSDYINGRALFIDNHFPERLDVATLKDIPVLDVDAVEFLLK